MDCIFCKIVKGEIPCTKVYEDVDVLAFLDVNPVSLGHCLVIPKQHSENIFDISENVLQKIIVVGKRIVEKLKTVTNIPAVNLVNSSGKDAGQEVMHFHLHIVPRRENDGLKIHGEKPKNLQKPSEQELQKLAELIKF